MKYNTIPVYQCSSLCIAIILFIVILSNLIIIINDAIIIHFNFRFVSVLLRGNGKGNVNERQKELEGKRKS